MTTTPSRTGRIAWMTDIHLDMLSAPQFEAFMTNLTNRAVDGLLLTGDIADGQTLFDTLEAFDSRLPFPVWFVLGNHDYYGTSIERQRTKLAQWCGRGRSARWLNLETPILLSEETALIGHDGWSDGRYGDFFGSSVVLNDYRFIDELTGHAKDALHARLKALADEAAATLESRLLDAFEMAAHVIVATHPPPFVEACWHEGQATLNEWTPHFSCKAIGDILKRVMCQRPDRSVHVYCGHTHSSGYVRILDNLEVTTGGARYGQPHFQHDILY